MWDFCLYLWVKKPPNYRHITHTDSWIHLVESRTTNHVHSCDIWLYCEKTPPKYRNKSHTDYWICHVHSSTNKHVRTCEFFVCTYEKKQNFRIRKSHTDGWMNLVDPRIVNQVWSYEYFVYDCEGKQPLNYGHKTYCLLKLSEFNYC